LIIVDLGEKLEALFMRHFQGDTMSERQILMVIATSIITLLAATATAKSSVVERDRVRIQAHLEQVEEELRSRDVSHLSPELRAERARNLDRLHAYRKAGEFPRNTHVAWRQPVFLDRDGHACAVAHLMIESGWQAEADAIAERENLAYLPDMKSPEVAQWVAQSGLTAEESAWIQPTYNNCNEGCSCDRDPVCGADGKTYVNPCFAENCGEVQAWSEGCCAVDDDIEWAGAPGYGAMTNACVKDPNEDSEQLCPDDSGSADAGVGSAHSDDGSDAACSAAGGGTPASSWLAAVMLVCLVGLRARQRRAAAQYAK
jgi:hypothetical protein